MKLCDVINNLEPAFVGKKTALNYDLYADIIRNAFYKVMEQRALLDSSVFALNECMQSTQLREHILSILPLVTATKCEEFPGTMSFFALTLERPNAYKFFFEMINAWLIPGRRLNIALTYSVDFRLPDIGNELMTLCEIMVHIENERELEQILDNFPAIETEIEMGLSSSYYAKKILEIKGFSSDEKTAMIQEDIAHLIDRFPAIYDQDILTEMQHILLICREEFKANRRSRHISRMIALHYFFRKKLLDSIKKSPEKRYIHLKFFNAKLKRENKQKNVLGIIVGVNFLEENEVFDKSHLIKAIQEYIPNVRKVDNSFVFNRRTTESICTLYLELEKSNQAEFTKAEINLLRYQLPSDLKTRIKPILHPVFMPRNEEEIIRNILSLSSQIKYVRDIPQVFITFDEQTHAKVFFTIILVRLLKSDSISIQEMFKNSHTVLKYIHDRCQYVGDLRRKYKKEATVFRVNLPKDEFLRRDHTIDINKARQTVVTELFNIIGDIRDFNGGMISRQNEVLSKLKHHLKDVQFNDLVMENYFYSITPVIMRNVLDGEPLRILFLMLLDLINKKLFLNGENYALKAHVDSQFVFIMIKAEDRKLKEEVQKAIAKLHLTSSQLASSNVSVYEELYFGYIYRSDDPSKQELFLETVQQTLNIWESKKHPLLSFTR